MSKSIEKKQLAGALHHAEWGAQVRIGNVKWSKNPGRDGRIWWPSHPIELSTRQKQRSPLPRAWKSSEELADHWMSRPHLASVIFGVSLPVAK